MSHPWQHLQLARHVARSWELRAPSSSGESARGRASFARQEGGHGKKDPFTERVLHADFQHFASFWVILVFLANTT